MLGTSWSQIEGKTPEQLAAEMRSSMGSSEGFTPQVSCRYVASLPDSEFQLPPGAQVQEISSGGVSGLATLGLLG